MKKSCDTDTSGYELYVGANERGTFQMSFKRIKNISTPQAYFDEFLKDISFWGKF